MSAGYFSRLAQRARGESGGIRPEVAPLYEGQAALFENEAESSGRTDTTHLPAISSPMTDQPNSGQGLPVKPGVAILHPVETHTVENHSRVVREEIQTTLARQSVPPAEQASTETARAETPSPTPIPAPAGADATLLPLQPPEKPAAHAPAREASSAPERAEPEPASLRIHIGRIEVRAVQPPPPAPAPRVDPHPAMSLDEYLRRLNEERR